MEILQPFIHSNFSPYDSKLIDSYSTQDNSFKDESPTGSNRISQLVSLKMKEVIPSFDDRNFSKDWEFPVNSGNFKEVYRLRAHIVKHGNKITKSYAISVFKNNGFIAKHETNMSQLISKQHPKRISKIYSVLHTAEHSIIISKWYRFGDMAAYLQENELDFDEKKDLLVGAAKALAELHDIGIIHRDLKLDNFLLFLGKDHEIKVRISDFSLSSKKGERTKEEMQNYYVSPPYSTQIENQPSYDIWSFGVMLYLDHLNLEPEDLPWSSLIQKLNSAKNDEEKSKWRHQIDQMKDQFSRQEFSSIRNPILSSLIKSCFNPIPHLRPSAKKIAKELSKL